MTSGREGQLYAEAHQFFDGDGDLVPALRALELTRTRIAPFLIYVPKLQIFGIAATIPAGTECGRLFETTPKRCIAGVGDPYVEVAWSRFFGTVRPSQYPGAFPIAEGLTLALGAGAVIPLGRYGPTDAATQGLTIGNNIWDFAPTVAFTYITKPILAGSDIEVAMSAGPPCLATSFILATTAKRLLTPSFLKEIVLWYLVGPSDRPSLEAICRLVRPLNVCSRICCSRRLRSDLSASWPDAGLGARFVTRRHDKSCEMYRPPECTIAIA